MDLRQTSLWAKYLSVFGWKVEKLSFGNVFIKTLPLVGSSIKIPRCNGEINFDELERATRKHRAFMVKIEPAVELEQGKNLFKKLQEAGFKEDRWSLGPTKTILLDLTQSEEALLKNLEKDTRYSIRLAEKRGVVVKETNDLREFKKLYFATAKRKRFWIAKPELEGHWNTFHKEGSSAILTAFFDSKPLATAILLWSEGKGQYQYAASATENREVMAPYLLLWKSVLFLKSKGCTVMDLEGLYDPRIPSTRKWKGFSLFKKGFGGREVSFIGSFSKYPARWAKALFWLERVF